MAIDGIDGRRLAIANELIARAIPKARTDRTFPGWVSGTLSRDRRFGSQDRRFYRELVYTAVRFLPWIESVHGNDRSRAALWLSSDAAETTRARESAFPEAPSPTAPISARTDAFNAAFPKAKACLGSLLPEWVGDECPALLEPSELAVVNSRAPLWLRARDGNVGSDRGLQEA